MINEINELSEFLGVKFYISLIIIAANFSLTLVDVNIFIKIICGILAIIIGILTVKEKIKQLKINKNK